MAAPSIQRTLSPFSTWFSKGKKAERGPRFLCLGWPLADFTGPGILLQPPGHPEILQWVCRSFTGVKLLPIAEAHVAPDALSRLWEGTYPQAAVWHGIPQMGPLSRKQ